MAKLRILVAEDSLTVRKRLVEVLAADPELEVVGEAADGKAAIESCRTLRPDAMTMDMMMPVMTGLAAVEYIMAHVPTPILIVSASVNRGELFRTYEALAAGALQVLEKPDGDAADDAWEANLRATVKMIARVKVITHLRARRASRPAAASPAAPARERGPGRDCRVVGIGASTGAPSALLEIVRALPASFPLPILIVIHLGAPFAAAFADWLDGLSPLRVAYARDGEPLPEPRHGRVILAPPDRHLVVRDGKLRLVDEPERHSCRPSVDVLFESLAREVGERAAGCLLTGMGKDGALGLLAMHRAGGVTFAQDEASSVVFGMPREAIALGAAQRVLPLEEFGAALAALAGARGRTP